MGHVFVDLNVVRAAGQRVKAQSEFMLRRCHFVMMLFHLQAHFGHHRGHFGAQVIRGIDRRHREIAALGARTVADIAFFVSLARVVGAFLRIDGVEHAVLICIVANVVEDEEFSFRTEINRVADAGWFHIGFGAPCG